MAQAGTSADSFMSHTHYVLCFCKEITARKVAPTLCSPSKTTKVQTWSRALHDTFIMPRAITFSDPEGSGPSNATMKQVLVTMSNMAMILATQHFIVSQSENNLPGFPKSGMYAKKLILLASSPDAESEATEMVLTCATFLDIKSIGSAREHLQNELKAAHGVDFISSTTLMADLSNSVFLWEQHDLPSHVSLFLCGDMGQFRSSSEESLQLHLKSEGAGISSLEIEMLVKKTSHSPMEFYRAQDQMVNYHSAFAFATGVDGALAICIQAKVDHMTIHKRNCI
jgi:hypothetical protein